MTHHTDFGKIDLDKYFFDENAPAPAGPKDEPNAHPLAAPPL